MPAESTKSVPPGKKPVDGEEFSATRSGQGEIQDFSTEVLQLLRAETLEFPRTICES